MASRDLKNLVQSGMLEPQGERRGRFYVRTETLADVDKMVRASRPAKVLDDPFALAEEALRGPTPGLFPANG